MSDSAAPSGKLVRLADEYVCRAQRDGERAKAVDLALKWFPMDNPWRQALVRAKVDRQFFCSQQKLFE